MAAIKPPFSHLRAQCGFFPRFGALGRARCVSLDER